MMSVPLTVRFLVAAGTAAVVVGCSSSDSGSPAAVPSGSTSVPTTSAPTGNAEKQAYLDEVNALCDALLPKVIEATHGGSTDVPAQEWVSTWPAHEALLAGFDEDLAEVSVPASATEAAQVMADYVVWATGIDRARIAAARQGEDAWQAELAAEADIAEAPELLALGPAGFNDSCQAR